MEIGFHLYFFLKWIATFPGYDSIHDVQKLNLVFWIKLRDFQGEISISS